MNQQSSTQRQAIVRKPALAILGVCACSLIAITVIAQQGRPQQRAADSQFNSHVTSTPQFISDHGGRQQADHGGRQQVVERREERRLPAFSQRQPAPRGDRGFELSRPPADPADPAGQPVGQAFSESMGPREDTHQGSVHRLQHISSYEFARLVANAWGEDLQVEPMDESGDRVRVSIRSKEGMTPLMMVDGDAATSTFVGPPQWLDAWRSLVTTVDSPAVHAAVHPSNPASEVELISVNARPSTIRQVVGFLQDEQEQTELIPMPRTQDNQSIVLQQAAQQELGLKGPVKIQIIEGMNMMVVTGDPQDVAKIKAFMQNIRDTALETKARSEIYLLRNTNSTRMQSLVEQAYSSYEQALGPVNVIPLTQPDRLLVIGQDEVHNVVQALIEQLDQETEAIERAPGHRTYYLKHMSALDAAARLDEYFASPATGDETDTPLEPIDIVDDYRTNSLVVKGSETSLRVVDSLIEAWDVAESETVAAVRIFRIRNAVAANLQLALQDAINGQLDGAGQGTSNSGQVNQFQGNLQNQFNPQAEAHIPVQMLEMMTIGENGELIRSGILHSVRITAEANSNSLIVTAPADSMELIAELIRQLDVIPEAETFIKVFTLYNGDATTLFQMFQSLFTSANNQQAGGGFNQNQTNIGQLPLQNASAVSGQTLVDLRFSVDTRSNSIIASGSAGDLQVVEDLLLRLDEDMNSMFETNVYRLSNAPVDDVATAINQWQDSRRNLNDIDPLANNVPTEQTRREVLVVPEVVTNSLIVSTTPENWVVIEQIIRALDRRPPMVQIKVLIAEVELRDQAEFGTEIGVQDSLLFDRGIGTIGFPFNQSGLGNNSDALALGTREDLAGQGLLNFSTGRTNGDLGYGGLVLSAGNESINILIRALQDKNRVQVLGSPHITTLDNLQATVIVGARVPRISNTQQTNFGLQNTVELDDIGIILQVTPRVSPDGMIVISVDAQNSSVGPISQGTPIFVGQDGTVLRSPQFPISQATSTVMARSGQSVAFSGLITKETNYVDRGVPILSDIPVVGNLFGFEQEIHRRKELLIILTPYLIDSDEQMDRVNQAEVDRMNWCLGDVHELYGPVVEDDMQVLEEKVPTIFYPDTDPYGLQPKNNHLYKTIKGGFEPHGSEDVYNFSPGETASPMEGMPPEFLESSEGTSADGGLNGRDSSQPIISLPPQATPGEN